MLHADAIATRSGSPISAPRDMSSRVWAGVRSLLATAARAWIARRAERHLMEMPDYLLKDIGIARSGIGGAVRRGRT
jgi:uncharacterized protein YjiS (DUF1127 family)